MRPANIVTLGRTFGYLQRQAPRLFFKSSADRAIANLSPCLVTFSSYNWFIWRWRDLQRCIWCWIRCKERPERPIPSGSARLVRVQICSGSLLLVVGVVAAAQFSLSAILSVAILFCRTTLWWLTLSSVQLTWARVAAATDTGYKCCTSSSSRILVLL